MFVLPSGRFREVLPYRNADAYGMNARGDLAGTLRTPRGLSGLAYLLRDGNLIDLTASLGDPSWTLFEAKVINDAGQIAGWGSHGGVLASFVLTPVR